MRINPHDPHQASTSQPFPDRKRTISFNQETEIAHFNNELPPHLSVESAKIKHGILKKPASPPPPPPPTYYAPAPSPPPAHQVAYKCRSNKARWIGNALAVAGAAIAIGCIATGPIGIGIGFAICMIGIIISMHAEKLVAQTTVPNTVDETKLARAIREADRKNAMVLDLRSIHVTHLPNEITDLPYLHFIFVNIESAKYLPKNIDGIEIIGNNNV